MSTLIEDYFYNAELAQAAYAIFNNGDAGVFIQDALEREQEESYSITQGTLFSQRYTVEHSQQNTNNGFSATLFKDTNDVYTLAIRGTEPAFNDIVLTDFGDIGGDGIAMKQAVDLFNYYQRLITPKMTDAIQLEFYEGVVPPSPGIPSQTLLDSGLVPKYRYLTIAESVEGVGEIPPNTQINVTGHSLGGHLSLILSRLDPDNIDEVYTFNAPGFDTGLVGSDDTEWFFGAISQLQQQEQGVSTVQTTGFPESKLHNLVIPLDLVSDIGTIPGEQIEQFGEAQNVASAHSITGMIDSLAVYKLLSALAPAQEIEQLTPFFQLGSEQEIGDIEGILNALGDLLGFGTKVIVDDRESLFKRVQDISDNIFVDSSLLSPQLKPEYINLKIVAVESLADFAEANNANGLAYRYALLNLTPFAIVDNTNVLYDQHNSGGELDPENFSKDYLDDRAEFLVLKNRLYTNNLTVEFAGNDKLFKGVANEIDLTTIGTASSDINRRQYLFGSDNAEAQGELTGGNKDDHIYGGGGNDSITDERGDSYLDGGSGDDSIEGSYGNDTIVGGTGNDYLNGGRENDTYLFNLGDGQDTINDYSGTDKIVFGAGINRDHIKLSQQGSNAIVIELTDDQGVLTGDKLTVQYGFSLPGYAIERLEFADGSYIDNAEIQSTVRTLEGTAGNDELIGSRDADSLTGYEGDDILISDRGNDIVYGGAGNDSITDERGDSYLDGGSGDDSIEGSYGNDTIVGGTGNDYLNGGRENDTYIINAGDGQDRINDWTGDDDLLINIASYEDLWFSREGNDLAITMVGSDDRVSIDHWFSIPSYQIEEIKVGEATLINNQVDQLVSAMAAYDVPAGVGNVILQETKDVLQPVLTQTWQTS